MFSKKDIESINELVSLAATIHQAYLKLFKLELENKKDTAEYKKVLEKVINDINNFDAILSNLSSDYEKLLMAYSYITKLDQFAGLDLAKSGLRLTFCTRLEATNDIILTYLKNRLFLKLITNSDYLLALNSEVLGDNQSTEYSETTKKILLFQYDYECSIINDIYTLFLTLVEQTKSKIKDNDVLEKLTKLKYSYGFILPYLQQSLLAKSFEVEQKPFVIHHSVADLYQLPEDQFRKSKRSIILNVVDGNLEVIKHLDDANFITCQKLTLAIDIEATIRASLVLADEQTRSIIEDLLEKIASGLEERTDKYHLITKILRFIPSKRDSDQELIQTITIGRF